MNLFASTLAAVALLATQVQAQSLLESAARPAAPSGPVQRIAPGLATLTDDVLLRCPRRPELSPRDRSL
jgi:hypothetical protein